MFKKSLQFLFCILPQSAFYSQSAVCILPSVCILPLVHSLQSTVRSLRFTLTDFKMWEVDRSGIHLIEKTSLLEEYKP